MEKQNTNNERDNGLITSEMMLKYSTVFNAAPVGLEYYDKNGILIDINERALHIYGVADKDDLLKIGACLYDNPNYKSQVKSEADRYRPCVLNFDYDFDLLKKENYYLNGSRSGKARIQNKIEPLLNEKGEIEGTIIATQDITDDFNLNYRYEQLYRERETVSDALPIGLAIYDKEGNQQSINPALASMFGIENMAAHLEKHINLFEDPIIPEYLKEEIRRSDNVEVSIEYNPQIASEENYFDTMLSDPIFLKCQVRKVKDASNETLAIMLLISDMTSYEKKSQELQEAHQNLSLALEAGEMSAWTYNVRTRKFNTLLGNAIAGEGISVEENLKILHPEDHQMQLNLLQALSEEKIEKATAVFRYLTEKGVYHYYESQMIAQKENGKIKHIAGTQKDVTEWYELTEKLKETNRQNNLILNNINSGLVYISTDYRVIWENVSVIFAPQCSDGEKLYEAGKFCYQSAYGRNEPCLDCPMMRAMASKEREHSEKITATGTLEVYANPILNEQNEVEGVILRIDDITQRKQIQTELEATKNEALASNEQLKLAKERAEQSDKLKSAFLANMSHEIRTPLNAIVGFSELLRYASNKEECEEYWSIISINNELLLTLIGDILDLSKIEAGYVDLVKNEFNLSQLFEEITMLYSLKMPAGVHFVCNTPHQNYMVNLDKGRLSQIMTNFINNAVKFTTAGTIQIGYNMDDTGLQFYCSDTGIGISKEHSRKIFERFEKLNDFAQGTGLGLSICKAIAEAQGGTIGFESEEGKGSTFWVHLPL